MKVKSIALRGFRGFNKTDEIEFDERLTLISAVNSYGKTSISEGFEWLIYGNTSKVEAGDYSKEEYKGSLRNCHLEASINPSVNLVLTDAGKDSSLTAEYVGDGIHRSVDGLKVNDWSFSQGLSDAPKHCNKSEKGESF